MRMLTITALAFSFTALATAQMREVWRYVYMPPQSELYAHLNRAVRLADGSLLLVGWVETPTNGHDALAIRVNPDGTEAWVYQRDGASLDDAFVDAVEAGGDLWLLAQFTDAEGYRYAEVHRLNQSGQPVQIYALSRASNAHLRPIRLTFGESWQPAVVAELVQNSESLLALYEADSFGYVFLPVGMRPWGVADPNPHFILMLGTRASASHSVDAFSYFYDVAFLRYSGPARGVDIPMLATSNGMEHYWVGIQSEGGITGEDVVVLAYNAPAAMRWGYRYSYQLHDDYAEDMVLDRRENLHLLVKTVLWRGEPFERHTLRLATFSPQGALLTDTELVPDGAPILSGLLRLNDAGERYVGVSAPSFFARLNPSGQPLWRQSVPMTLEALFPETDGSVLTAGILRIEERNEWGYWRTYERLGAIKYAPNGDLNGDGCVDDADLIAVLFAFGQSGSGLQADVNTDGVVDDADLLTVLFHFGSGC
ncbi:MAG: hypothetical protein K6U12_03180 [Armatimonadetes bacterium]|nr:hypothetical protein [Armatimonadota bacterium]CUU38071.1 hypothetical protein DCOP10_123132 [Armatimonadetes bacterium DC]